MRICLLRIEVATFPFMIWNSQKLYVLLHALCRSFSDANMKNIMLFLAFKKKYQRSNVACLLTSQIKRLPFLDMSILNIGNMEVQKLVPT
jgi:hypothetical protein